jgi:uroporphyrinogen decarboxylase
LAHRPDQSKEDQMELTARERLLRALRFEEVDLIPATLPYAGSLGQFGCLFLQDDTIPQDKRQLLAQEMEMNPRAFSLFMYPPDIYRDGRDQWGVYWDRIHDVSHPIEDWDDYPRYEFPEINRDLFPRNEIVECRREARTVIFGGAWPIVTFERYRTLRGFENSLTDPLLYPDRFQELLERIVDYNLQQIRQWIEIGCDLIGFADDWGTDKQMLVSPALWREFYKPIYRRFCDLIHESGAKTWMHSDGAIAAILPDLVEIGVDILEPVQAECVDIHEIADRFRSRLVISGGLNSRLIARGGYETARAHVEEVIDVFRGFCGGMIGTTTNLLLPSIDVALALYRAYRRAH